MRITKENVIVGTLLLSASSIFVRMIGFVFRVYLSNTMGAEGMGLYTLIMSLYHLCATVATSGISTAVSKLAAERLAVGGRADARRILGRSVSLSLAISVTVAVVVLFFADFIAGSVLRDPRTALSLKLLAPGMPFLAVSSCLRGYFIAGRRMANTASGQVLEQFCKMTFILLLMGWALPRGIETGCALVVLGMTVGEAVCLLWTIGGYALERRRIGNPGRASAKGVTRSILGIAVPISISSYARSALRLVEDVLIVSGFKRFSGQDDVATGAYGVLKGMVMPLLIFPLSLLSAFVVTLTPEISRLGAKNNHRQMERAISMVLRYTSIIGIFIVGVFSAFSYELGVVVYRDGQVGEMLRSMAFLVPFMCLEMVVVAILQGLGEQVSSLRYNVGDCFLRIALVYFLIPRFGVNGFIVMVVASNLFTSLLNLKRLLGLTKMRVRWREWIFQPALATLAAGQGCKALFSYLLLDRLPMWQGLVLGLCLMGAIYVSVMFAIGALKRDDIGWITERIRLSSKPPKTEPEPEV